MYRDGKILLALGCILIAVGLVLLMYLAFQTWRDGDG